MIKVRSKTSSFIARRNVTDVPNFSWEPAGMSTGNGARELNFYPAVVSGSSSNIWRIPDQECSTFRSTTNHRKPVPWKLSGELWPSLFVACACFWWSVAPLKMKNVLKVSRRATDGGWRSFVWASRLLMETKWNAAALGRGSLFIPVTLTVEPRQLMDATAVGSHHPNFTIPVNL